MYEEYKKLESVVGNKHKYQKVTLAVSMLVWLSSFSLVISLPFLQKMPTVSYIDEHNVNFTQALTYKICENYNFTIIHEDKYSWVCEFKIYCDKVSTGLIAAFMAFGVFIGGILQIFIVDQIGGRKVLIISMLLYSCIIFLLNFIDRNNIYLLYSLIFLANVFSSSCILCVYLFVSEINSGTNRVFYSSLINSSYSLGTLLLITIYNIFGNNEAHFYTSFAIGLLSTILIIFFFYETPKFYFLKGLFSKFLVSFNDIAKFNGVHDNYEFYLDNNISRIEKKFYYEEIDDSESIRSDINPENWNDNHYRSPDLTLNFNSFNNESKENNDENVNSRSSKEKDNTDLRAKLNKIYKSRPSVVSEEEYKKKYKLKARKRTIYSSIDLLKYASQRHIFLKLCFIWFTISFTYYGLRTHLRKENSHMFLMGIISNSAEFIMFILAGLLINLHLFGRVRLIIIFQILSIAGLIFVTIYNKLDLLNDITLISVDFLISGIFLALYVYSFEVYPICISAKGFSLNFVIGRLGIIISNMLIEILERKIYFFIIMIILNFLSIFATYFLPDTLGIVSPEEIPEVSAED